MKALIRFMVLALVLQLAAPLAHAGDDDVDQDVLALCQSGYEGSGKVTIGDNHIGRLNVFCIDKDRFAASLYIEGMINLSLTYAAVSHGILILSQFPLDLEYRKGSATTSMTYLKLNIEHLSRGVLSGYVINGNLTFPLAISGQFDQHFPQTLNMTSKEIDHSQFIGQYAFQMPGANSKVKEDVDLWVDINRNIPMINMKIKIPNAAAAVSNEMRVEGGSVIHFIDGSQWDRKTGFDATTTFSDSSATGVTLWHLRGRVVDTGVLELYVIDPVNGLRGPVIAKKIGDPGAYLDMKLGPDGPK